jgi:hypothetical protein
MPVESKLIDGKRALGVELIEFARGEDFAKLVTLSGGRIPIITDIDATALPCFAVVNFGRWITHCPQPRCTGSSFVWIGGPHQFMCIVCANLGIGARWRPVILPTDWEAIESVLRLRHILTERNWTPGESIGDLLVENLDLGYAIPIGLEDLAEAAIADREAHKREAEEAAAKDALAVLPPVPFPDIPRPE